MQCGIGPGLIFVLASLTGLAGCSGRDDREVAARDPGPDSAALAPLGDSSADSFVEQQTRSGAQAGPAAPSAAAPRAPAAEAHPPRKHHAASRVKRRAAPESRHDSSGGKAAPTAEAPETTAQGYRASDGVRDSVANAGDRPANVTRKTPAADSTTDSAIPGVPPAPPPPTRPSTLSTPGASSALPAGTEIRAALQDSISSLRNSVGQRVTALVVGDLRAADGLTVLPSGAPIRLTIERIRPAVSRSAKDGELVLRPDSVTVGGTVYRLDAVLRPIPHELRGRGITAGEVEKVGAGAAAGAVIGGVVTGKTKGAVIGGAVGAAGGAVVAAQTASRDVIVTPKTMLTLVLRQPVTRAKP